MQKYRELHTALNYVARAMRIHAVTIHRAPHSRRAREGGRVKSHHGVHLCSEQPDTEQFRASVSIGRRRPRCTERDQLDNSVLAVGPSSSF